MKWSAIKIITVFTIVGLFGCGGNTGDGSGDGSRGTPQQLTTVEEDLLALINAERTTAGLPALVRDTGLDQIELWYGTEMATEEHLGHIDLNGRGAEERARYYSGVPDVRCSEIVQWWGGTPSGSVHYEGYKASPAHHSAYMEEGLFNLGPTTHTGVIAMSGRGPVGSSYEGRDGSYTAVMLCDQSLTLVIDPFSE